MALTRHPSGSMRELWHISFPLMLSSLSVMLMIFVDRLFLAHYSLEAMNASVSASTMAWGFVVGGLALGSISEVFVAQYNGAKQYERMGAPVWQMIWMGVFSAVYYLIIAQWGRYWIYGYGPEFAMEREFFRWMLYFGPSFAIFGALSGFFIGQGQTRIITVLAFGANFVNAILDYLLIFGVEGYIPSLGVTGAAIGTSLSSVFEMLVLFYLFLTPHNRKVNNTWDWRIKWSVMRPCLRIGLPGAVFIMVEIFGWGAYYVIMAEAGKDYITVAGIAQTFVVLLFFFAEGISKAATALAGNFIGEKSLGNVHKLLRAGIGLHFLFLLFMGAFFGVFSDFAIKQFLPEATPEFIQSIEEPLKVSIFCMIFYLFFDGVRFLLSGILTAAGDTLFLFVAGSLFMWLFLVLPVYIAVFYFGASIVTASFICVLFSAGATFLYYGRFRLGKWKTSFLIGHS